MASLLAADRRALGLFRIGFGLVLLGDALRRFALIPLFYSNEGVLSSHYALYNPLAKRLFSVLFAFQTPNEVRVAWLLTVLVYTLYTLGYATRTMQVLTLLLVTSWNVRNLLVEHPGTWFPGVVAAWSLFLPVADRFSIDALRRDLDERKELTAAALADRPQRAPRALPFSSVAVLAVGLQLAIAYALLVYQHPSADTFVALLGEARIVTRAGAWLHGSGVASLAFRAAQVLAVVAAVLSLVPIKPARVALPVVALLFWVPGAIVFEVGALPWAFLALHLVLLPRELLDAIADRLLAARPERTVVVDATDGVLFRVARILARVDAGDRLTILAKGDPNVPEGAPNAVFATHDDESATWKSGTAAIASASGSLPLGRVLEPVLGSQLGARLLRAMLLRRSRLAAAFQIYAGLPPFVDDPEPREGRDVLSAPEPSPLAVRWAGFKNLARESFAFVLLLGATAQVLHDNEGLPAGVRMKNPTVLAPLTEYPRLLQDWNVYAEEAKTNGSVVIDATTQAVVHLDPFTSRGPDFDAPHHGSLGLGPFHAAYFERIRHEELKLYRDEVRHWLGVWQKLERRPAEDKLVAFEMVWVEAPAGADGAPVTRTQLLSGR